MIISSLIFLALYWLLIRYITNHKSFFTKPEVEQLKVKKQLYWGLAIPVVVFLGMQLLISSKSTGWIIWLIFGIYLALCGVGIYLIWLAYRLGIRKELALVKKANGQPFNNPHTYIDAVAIVNLVTGLLILFLAIAIPIFKIKLALWAPIIFVASSCKQLIMGRFEKKDAA